MRLFEYDRSRTENSIGAVALIQRLSPHDWRTLAVHYDGNGLGDWKPEENLEVYTKHALGIDVKWKGIRTYPEYKYDHYVRYVVDFIMDICEQADPTSKKKFAPQILRWWYNGRGMSYLEDVHKAHDYLQTYIKFKNRITGLDLSKIDFYDFCDKMDEISAIPSGSEEDKAEQQRFFASKEATLLVDNDRVRVVIPHTEEAAKYFGRNTRWCTSAKNGNQFESYNRRGPLYIILFKAENARWQWHFEAMQFMDEKDIANDETNVRYIVPKFPELVKIWDEGMRPLLGWNPGAILKMFEPTIEDFRMVFLRGSTPYSKSDQDGIRIRVKNVLTRDSWNTVAAKDRPEIIALAKECREL